MNKLRKYRKKTAARHASLLNLILYKYSKYAGRSLIPRTHCIQAFVINRPVHETKYLRTRYNKKKVRTYFSPALGTLI